MDQAELDKKYFLTEDTYNCPYCKRGSVQYRVDEQFEFDWSHDRVVQGYLVQCCSCQNTSLHLSDYKFFSIHGGFSLLYDKNGNQTTVEKMGKGLDDIFFYHQPTSFFTVDSRIPKAIRELMTEADGCLKLNYLVGGSGALRKTIYELLKKQEAQGDNYQDKIMWLKQKYPQVYEGYFDILANVKDMTSENLHEQDGSWEPWSNKDLRLFISTVKEVLYELYVTPDQKAKARDAIMALKSRSSFKDSKPTPEVETSATDDEPRLKS